MQEADVSPEFLILQSVQGMTGADASLASRAGVEIDGERVLFVRFWTIERNEVSIISSQGRERVAFVLLREAFDSRETLLRIQQFVDPGPQLAVANNHPSLVKNS